MKKQLLILFCFVSISFVAKSQWTAQSTGFTRTGTYPFDLEAVDSNVIWLVGNPGDGSGVSIQEYSVSVDGGNLWTVGSVTSDTNYHFSNITAANGNLAWATMYYNTAAAGGSIFRTTDGGFTWNALSPGSIYNTSAVSFPNLTHFWNDSVGFSMGDPAGGYYEIYTTTDSGSTWTRVNTANIPAPTSGEYGLVDCYSVVDSTIWYGTNKGRVFKSTDLGHTWTVSVVGNIDGVTDVTFKDANNGLCLKYNSVSTLYSLYRTTDGGTTWNLVTPAGTMFKSEIYYVPGTSTLLSCGASTAGRGSSYSLNDGSNWTVIDTGATSVDGDGYTGFAFVNAHTGWAGGFTTNIVTGGISKWLGGPVAVNPVSSGTPVLAAYPNPGRDFVRLTMNTDKRADVRIYVTDALGRTVYSVNEKVVNGQLNHLLQVENWKSGIYFATIEWNAGKVQRKIVVQ